MADGNTFYLKAGDTYPKIMAVLTDGEDEPIDLTGASVLFRMSIQGPANFFLEEPATIEDAPNGRVSYDWQSGDTDATGTYLAEWEVTFGNGKVATFPRGEGAGDDYNTVQIDPIVD